MKKIVFTIVFATLLAIPVLVVTNTAQAVDVLDPVCQNADPNNLPAVCEEAASNSGENPLFGPDGIVTRVTQLLARIVGVAAIIAIIFYGLKLTAAGGDAAAAKTARSGILYALIGLVLAVAAQAIVTFVLNRL